jgi:hypothetical protein
VEVEPAYRVDAQSFAGEAQRPQGRDPVAALEGTGIDLRPAGLPRQRDGLFHQRPPDPAPADRRVHHPAQVCAVGVVAPRQPDRDVTHDAATLAGQPQSVHRPAVGLELQRGEHPGTDRRRKRQARRGVAGPGDLGERVGGVEVELHRVDAFEVEGHRLIKQPAGTVPDSGSGGRTGRRGVRLSPSCGATFSFAAAARFVSRTPSLRSFVVAFRDRSRPSEP